MRYFFIFFAICWWFPSTAQSDTLGIKDCACHWYNEDLDYCTIVIPKGWVLKTYNCIIDEAVFSPLGVPYVHPNIIKLQDYTDKLECNYSMIIVHPISEAYVGFYFKRPLKA